MEPVKCSVCGKLLTDPDSIKRGIGPVCYDNIVKDRQRERKEREENDRMWGKCKKN